MHTIDEMASDLDAEPTDSENNFGNSMHLPQRKRRRLMRLNKVRKSGNNSNNNNNNSLSNNNNNNNELIDKLSDENGKNSMHEIANFDTKKNKLSLNFAELGNVSQKYTSDNCSGSESAQSINIGKITIINTDVRLFYLCTTVCFVNMCTVVYV